ncbi:hypothetical protein ACIQAL_24050 [Pseudomonas sp. NPDC088368]|jgi:hypothetical protein|uniref:hypothetical protein n=1 Tax=Pseudomonas sp. NPDC088368 TaxID=3364453 RepID=UPI003800DC2B
MNPLMSAGSVESYYDSEEYDFAPLEPGSEATEGPVQLTPEGIKRLSSDMTELFRDIYDPNLIDPVQYIRSSIKRMVNESSAYEEVKERVDGQTWITVSSIIEPGLQALWELGWDGLGHNEERRDYRLEEIVTDTYRRKLTRQHNAIKWPGDFTEDLIEAFESADLQASYQADVEKHLNNPKARFLSKFQARIEVETRLRKFAENPDTTDIYKQLVQDYFDEKVSLESVQFRDQLNQYSVPRVAYLRYPATQNSPAGGLLIFLGEPAETAVLELPKEGRRSFIETSKELHRLMFKRLPLKAQLTAGNDKFSYVYSFMGPLAKQIAPLQFFGSDDIFETLHDLQIALLKGDIDILVSTDGERLNDLMFQVGITVFEALAIVVAAPAGPSLVLTRALVTALAGGGAVAFRVLRGVNEDLPNEARAFYEDALKEGLKQLIGPIVEFATGSEHASEVISQVTDIVVEELLE